MTNNDVTQKGWSKSELEHLTMSDDLLISPLREDGIHYGTPTWVWSVVVGEDLFVRAYNGIDSRWHQAAVKQKAGKVYFADDGHDVSFEPISGEINDLIDFAYRKKYEGSSYLPFALSQRCRASTIKISPRSADAKNED